MDIEAVIFDLGGTLIEYAGPYGAWPELETPGFEAAYQDLQAAGVPLPSLAQFRQTGFDLLPGRWQAAVEGRRNLRLVDMLTEVLHTCCGVNGISPQTIWAAAGKYEQAICAQAHPLANARDTLAAVSAGGYRLGLISNTMFTGAAHQNDLRRFGLDGYFHSMLFSADVAKWKPTPAPFQHVVSALGTTPAAAVFIGDSPEHDVVGAQQAGLRAVLIRSSQRFPLPDRVQPDAVIHGLAELPALLAGWSTPA